MTVENIKYENLNGLSGSFKLSDKLNVFVGSNGVGKTTSLDCLSILLFNESFSYDKSVEKHINVNDKSKVVKLSMVVVTDEIINGEAIKINFGTQISLSDDNKLSVSKYVNDKKVTLVKYNEYLCKCFNIPAKLLDVEKINLLRVLVDPNALSNSENVGVYNLVKELTNVCTLEEYAKNNSDYNCLLKALAMNSFDIKDTKKFYKDEIDKLNSEVEYTQKRKQELEVSLDEANSLDEEWKVSCQKYEELNSKFDELCSNVDETKKNMELSFANDCKEKNDFISKNNQEIVDLVNKSDELYRNINTLNNNFNTLLYRKNTLSKKLDDMRVEYAEVEKTNFYVVLCPHCGKSVNDKERDEFENKVKEYLGYLTPEIEKSEKELSDVEGELLETSEKLKSYTEEKENIDIEISSLRTKIYNVSTTIVEKSNATLLVEAEYNKLLNDKNSLSVEISKLSNDINLLKHKKAELENTKHSILGLEKKELDLLGLIAKYEQELQVLVNLNINYTKLIENKIEEVFGDVKINMVTEGKNKKEKVNCYAIYGEKPLFNYNTAPQIALGCKIISKIKQHLNIGNLPILFDIVDNIGEKCLNEIMQNSNGQVVCTKATFNENVKLSLLDTIEKFKENI